MHSKIKILLIESGGGDIASVASLLSANGYWVIPAQTGKEGLCLAASLCPNIILLDLIILDTDGCWILQQLRGWSNVPIIVLSTSSREEEKVTALDMGADDHITKPFGTEELLARIRASLRHSYSITPHRIYKALDLEIHFDKRLVLLAGEEIHMTQIEYQILTLLAIHSDNVLSYSFIMNALWGPYADSNNKILRVNMSNIRRKLRENPSQPQYIFTETGTGYRMRKDENIKTP